MRHYIAASIKNGTVYVEVDFGDGAVATSIGTDIIQNFWNNLTITHHQNVIGIHLNQDSEELELPGPNYHLYIDPEIYIGGGPELHKKKGKYLLKQVKKVVCEHRMQNCAIRIPKTLKKSGSTILQLMKATLEFLNFYFCSLLILYGSLQAFLR